MSGQPPPPKPKPGSLRDRIAAFENKPAAAPGPPAPRPKPAGGVSWKPKAPSPPSSPQASPGSAEHAPNPEKKVVSGMNASDAKDSIGLGGSLKDRMAALQGRGAFGALDGGAPAPPKPATQKPKWKPPPVVSPPDDDGEGETPSSNARESAKPALPIVQKGSEDESPKTDAGGEPGPAPEGGEEAEQLDPEEEERQRRAAIAARMARLGGARVGMSPPVFGKKPSIKKPDLPKDDETQTLESKPAESSTDQTPLKSPPIKGTPEEITSDKAGTEGSSDYFVGTAPRRSSTSSSLLSVDSAPQASKSPSSMPVPSVPRRAAPPRKKTPKSPSPAPVTRILDETPRDSPETSTDIKSDAVEERHHELQGGDRQEQIGEVDKEVGSVPEADKSHVPAKPTPILSEGNMVADSPAQVEKSENEAEATRGDHGTREPEMYIGEPADTHESQSGSPALTETETTPVEPVVLSPPVRTGEVEEGLVEEPVEELTEEEEVARRKRIAEKLGMMGGINPLAPRPPFASSPPTDDEVKRKDRTGSEGVEHSVVSSPSAKFPSETTRQGSKDSVNASPPIHESTVSQTPSPELEAPARKDSTKSVESSHVLEPVSHQDHEDDLSQRHKEFCGGPENEELVDETYGKHSEEERSPDHEYFAMNEEADEEDLEQPYDDLEKLEDSEIARAGTTRSIPPPPVPNMSARPDAVHDKRGSEGLTRRSLLPPPRGLPLAPESELETERHQSVVSPRLSRSFISSPPVPAAPHKMPERTQEAEEQLEEDATPYPQQRSIPPPPRQSVDFAAQKAPSPAGPRFQHKRTSSSSAPATSSPVSPTRPDLPSSSTAPASSARPVPTALAISDKHDFEILDEEEGDPIDPAFHAPNKTPPNADDRASPPPVSQSPPIPPVPVPDPETEDHPEQARRHTIAERMAKLGGIKFGAPPPIGRAPPSSARVETVSAEQPGVAAQEDQLEDQLEEVPETEEEEERARKQRIASKLAGMGGVGMFGAPQRAPLQPRVRRQESEETAAVIASPPQRAVPPSRPLPPPQQIDTDSELESHHTSEDGVKVEAEDSEPEEVRHEDAAEPEVPPPVPSRSGRPASHVASVETMASPPPRKPTQSPPPVPGGRPPVPSVPTNRKPSIRKSSADYVPSSARMGSFDTSRATPLVATPPSEYVMVEEPENIAPKEAPPPPPPRPSRGPPSRPAPPPTMESSGSGWEMPSIPTSLTFEGPRLDLSLSSWSEDSTSYPAPPAPDSHPPPPPQQKARRMSAQVLPKPPVDPQLSSEELMGVWGRVGVQICETATTLFEKSKRSLVGDGSYYGFVNAVFTQVPNARPPSSSGYGYLIYAQTGPTVSRRVSEIMPGDVVELYDAMLKGHKGLQSYHQNVGAGEPLVGIVNEFEPKKSKVKMFHANQHVGQQTVESVSYRLEDLKSGVVKIFRVLEA